MIRLTKKLLGNTALSAGLLLTLAAVALDAFEALVPVERFLLDERIKRCQFFMPPPTDRLVHLDIDDGALETIGLWPWDRSVLAQITDELAVAGPAAVGLDLLFTEPQAPGWRPQPDGQFMRVDHDALLAASLGRLGNAVVPASFSFPAATASGVFGALRDALADKPELTESQLVSLLRTRGFGDDPRLHSKVADAYLTARRVAMGNRLRRELGKDPSVGDDVVRGRVLPAHDPALKSPLARLFDVQLTRARAALELRRFARKPMPGEPQAFAGRLNLVPIYPLVRAAAASGFVDYPPATDGRVRSVPLFIQHDGVMYPQMGLSLACLTMGTRLQDVRVEAGRVVVPRKGRPDLAIPTRTLDQSVMANVARDVPLATDLPWFGGDNWEQMYDPAGAVPRKQHLSILAVWEACEARRKIEQNNREADESIRALYEKFDPDKLAPYVAAPPAADDAARRVAVAAALLPDVEPFVTAIAEQPAAQQTDDDRKLVASFRTLQRFAEQTPGLAENLARTRAWLAEQLGGKAVLVGWIATASIADFIPTPLHAKCPGPVLHGVVFNAILTGEVWRRAPAWVSPLITLAVGLLMTGVVTYFAPARATLAAVALGAAYLILNGIVLFDYANLIVGAAGPLTAVGLVWSGGTLTRFVVEQQQRRLIERRFRTYVDPKLVDYFMNHPEATTDGQKREMTVVFTDLVGFTKLTEALGEDTVKLLNELWARVVPVVRRDDGLLNKFLGDGVMFFHGAPQPNDNHAADAVRTVLELRRTMTHFNATVTRPRGLPELGMRFGISTGDMIVGDAGGGGGSDYTVLGDNVNLGSRLEGANKATGTTNLMTARTAELAKDGFLFRPVGKLRVVGKVQGVMTYEALCPAADATPQQREAVEISRQMVDAYTAQDLAACIVAAGSLEAVGDPSKLAQLYRRLAERHLNSPDAEPFDGLITLSEK
jgi:class 3 adenylate cyclase